MIRSVMIYQREMLVNSHGEHKKVTGWLADDIANGDANPSVGVVRLPRRLFRGRLRSYHNTWMLHHGARLGSVL